MPATSTSPTSAAIRIHRWSHRDRAVSNADTTGAWHRTGPVPQLREGDAGDRARALVDDPEAVRAVRDVSRASADLDRADDLVRRGVDLHDLAALGSACPHCTRGVRHARAVVADRH